MASNSAAYAEMRRWIEALRSVPGLGAECAPAVATELKTITIENIAAARGARRYAVGTEEGRRSTARQRGQSRDGDGQWFGRGVGCRGDRGPA